MGKSFYVWMCCCIIFTQAKSGVFEMTWGLYHSAIIYRQSGCLYPRRGEHLHSHIALHDSLWVACHKKYVFKDLQCCYTKREMDGSPPPVSSRCHTIDGDPPANPFSTLSVEWRWVASISTGQVPFLFLDDHWPCFYMLSPRAFYMIKSSSCILHGHLS